MMVRILTVVAAVAVLPACTAKVEPPKAKVIVPAVSVETSPGFCPPGQAKKGNC